MKKLITLFCTLCLFGCATIHMEMEIDPETQKVNKIIADYSRLWNQSLKNFKAGKVNGYMFSFDSQDAKSEAEKALAEAALRYLTGGR